MLLAVTAGQGIQGDPGVRGAVGSHTAGQGHPGHPGVPLAAPTGASSCSPWWWPLVKLCVAAWCHGAPGSVAPHPVE